jgi:hypothetical protein
VNRSWLIIALAAGALSTVAFMGLLRPSAVSIAMFYLAPAPLFMAGLAFGWLAAAIAAAAGALAIAVMLNVKAAGFYLLTTGLAPVILTRLALISRPAAGGAEGEAADEHGREWYPEGRLLLWTAAMAGALMTLTALLLGPGLERFQAVLRAMAMQMLKTVGAAQNIDAAQLARLTDFIVATTPLVSTAMWEITILANLALAAWLLKRFGYPTRPWAPFWRLAFHPRAMIALAVASFASFLPGMAGLAGEIFAAALMTAFAILGLAVVHALTRGNPYQPIILGLLYAGLFLLNWMLALPLIILALADLTFGLRARLFAGRGGPPART